MLNFSIALEQWFPTFLISRSHSKILHKRSATAINCNAEGVQITTNKTKNTPSFHMLDSLYLHSYAKHRASVPSASADSTGCIRPTNFCSTKLFHELKNSSCEHRSIHLLCLSRKKGKLKVCWTSKNNSKIESFLAYFMRILNFCVV